MAASRFSSCAAAAAAVAAAVSVSTSQNKAYADGSFRFNPFSSSPKQPADQPSNANSEAKQPEREESKGSGFDPEALERGAKALREINSSPLSKQVFDLMRRQEDTRLAEVEAEKDHYAAIQAHKDIERQRNLAEEQRNLVQQQAQAKAQMLRYEDDLARKRMQTDHETQRKNNVELARMQEQSSIRKEQARRSTEEQIQAQQRQTEKERAEIERETIRVKAMAEAEGRAHEAKLTEEHNRRMLVEKINGEREKWLAAINATFSHIEGGFRTLFDDRNKLIMTVGGATGLAAGIYTTRRNSTHMSEAQRSALNALLFRTGDQSRDIVLVLATNRPGDLDSAVTDRIDEVIEFPLPGEDERFKLINLYLNKYLSNDGNSGEEAKWSFFFNKKPQKITVNGVTEEVIREAAKRTEGFSGREIAKLMASVQAAVYGRADCVLDSEVLKEVVDYKVAEHHQRIKLASEGGQSQPSS
ncbi:ATPase family AAA domain-containing protein 3-B [Linum grandiflorum]